MPAKLTPREVWTSDEGTMARETALTRWPKIMQTMIDDVETTFSQSENAEHVGEGRRIQASLRIMKEEIMGDKPLHPLNSDGGADIEGYNAQLAGFGHITWHNCPWMFAECYLYRFVQTLFARSQLWRNYDIFARQKLSAFLASHAAVEELSERYMSLAESLTTNPDPKAAELAFTELTSIALWGNATDLSLHPDINDQSKLQSLQGTHTIQNQDRIVSNDLPAVWAYLSRNQAQPQSQHQQSKEEAPKKHIAIILDNTGFELFTDLLHTLLLLDLHLATTITLHVKSIPWFVSDVLPHDIPVLLSALTNSTLFPTSMIANPAVQAVAGRLREGFDTGKVKVKEDGFWTTGYGFEEMEGRAPGLWGELRGSEVVVFKGDLNYRKLVGDRRWGYGTPFREAIGSLGRGGMKILALRTNKADVCVGVDGEVLERVEREAPGGEWVRNGRYAVISFSDGSD
ncbi:DUF89 domain protein [Dichotomopilus funicola]|uniref:Sugar phosphate phosphatase n=1 Tax=Dichotomopilus funicola TaxID=1934379 RepID=A0AAN6UZM4_9PEZI|nr:DUF89 domain protein [Dichotomopilus funicola]